MASPYQDANSLSHARGGVAWPAWARPILQSWRRAIRAALEWRGVGIAERLELLGMTVNYDNSNSANSNSKSIPVALEWRDGFARDFSGVA